MIRSGTLTRILLHYAALGPEPTINADQAETWLNNAWRFDAQPLEDAAEQQARLDKAV